MNSRNGTIDTRKREVRFFSVILGMWLWIMYGIEGAGAASMNREVSVETVGAMQSRAGTTACGQTTTGTLGTSTQRDSYTFSASAGEAVIISAVGTSGSVGAVAELFNPSGTKIGSNDGGYGWRGNGKSASISLTVAGSYTIVVSDWGLDNTGTYDLNLQFTTGRCGTAISCGQIKSGSLASKAQIDTYTFSAGSGEALLITGMGTSGNMAAVVELFDPSGKRLGSNDGGYGWQGNGRTGSIVLAASGTFTIVISDWGQDNTGNYDLNLQFATGRCGTAISCGQTKSGSLTSKSQNDIFPFSANSGEAVIITGVGTSGNVAVVAELFNPSGTKIASNDGGYGWQGNGRTGSITLTATGTFTIVVRDWGSDHTGAYDLNLQFTTGRCGTAISCGQTKSAALTSKSQDDAYSFTANSGEAVNITGVGISGSVGVVAELFDPAGKRVASNDGGYGWRGNGRTGSVALSTAGTYTIVVTDWGLDNVGNYDLNLQFTTGKCGTAIACGQTKSGSLSSGVQYDAYSFNANLGEAVIITGVGTSGNVGAVVELYDPTGRRIASNDGGYGWQGNGRTASVALGATGTYTIVVADWGSDNTGNYGLNLQFTTGRCGLAITCGQTKSETLSSRLQNDAYTFSANANEAVLIAGKGTSGSVGAVVELFNSAGKRVASNDGGYGWQGNGRIASTLLSSAGTYTIVVTDWGLDNAGNYDLNLQFTTGKCGAAIACGQTKSGNLSSTLQYDAYVVNANANEAVIITGIGTSGSVGAVVEVYDTSGKRIATNDGGYGWQGNGRIPSTVLPSAGNYTIVVSDWGSDNTGGYDLNLQFTTGRCGSPIACGQTRSGSLNSKAQNDIYTFSANANEAVIVTGAGTSGGIGAVVELFNPSGKRLASNDGGYGWRGNGRIGSTLLTSAGNYTVVVTDWSFDHAGGYDLNLQFSTGRCGSAIACGQTRSASLSSRTQNDAYTLTAGSGDAIRLTAAGAGINPYVELFDANGTRITYYAASSGNFAGVDKTLASSGSYTVIFSDYGNDSVGDYSLVWQKLNSPCNVKSIACGQTISNSIGARGKQDLYVFEAAVNDAVTIKTDVISGSLSPYLELYDSQGKRLASGYSYSGSSASIQATLSASGTFAIVVSDYGNDHTGSYRLKLQKNNNSCPEATLITPNGGEVTEAGATLTISWTASSPRSITAQELRLSTDSGSTYPSVIAGVTDGAQRTFSWNIPATYVTGKGRVRITVSDSSGSSVSAESAKDFYILQNVAKTSRSYSYDELSRLVRVVQEQQGTVTYTYDAVGNRTSLSVPNAMITDPPPGSKLKSATVTFSWTAGTGVSEYYLSVGKTQGGKEIYDQDQGTKLSAAVPGLPTDASAIYVRLWSLIGSTWGYNDSSYTACSGCDKVPGKATLVSPSGKITTTTPTYIWKAVASASQYQLWVGDSSSADGKIMTWCTAIQAGCASGEGNCSVTPPTSLALGAAQWWIQTWNDAGYGPWSDGLSFEVAKAGPPGKATLIAPSGNINMATPTYTWNAVADASWYQLWVNDGNTASGKIKTWFTAAQAGCASGTGTCSVTPTTGLALGAAQWWIQTWNDNGYGPWSDGMGFTVTGSASARPMASIRN